MKDEIKLVSILIDTLTNLTKEILSLNDNMKSINSRLEALEENKITYDRKIICVKDRRGSDIYYEVNSIGKKSRVSKKYALDSNIKIIYENEKVCEEKEKDL